MCVDSPPAFHNQVVGDESGNKVRASGHTEICRLFDGLSDAPIVTEKEIEVWNGFKSTLRNSILCSSRTAGNSSSNLILMQRPFYPSTKLQTYRIPWANGIHNIWPRIQNQVTARFSSEVKEDMKQYMEGTCVCFHAELNTMKSSMDFMKPNNSWKWWNVTIDGKDDVRKTAYGNLSYNQF